MLVAFDVLLNRIFILPFLQKEYGLHLFIKERSWQTILKKTFLAVIASIC